MFVAAPSLDGIELNESDDADIDYAVDEGDLDDGLNADFVVKETEDCPFYRSLRVNPAGAVVSRALDAGPRAGYLYDEPGATLMRTTLSIRR